MILAMRYLALLLLLSACGAEVQPLAVASVTIDAARSGLTLRCQYSTPACDHAREVLNAVIKSYNAALSAQAQGLPGSEQEVADAAVSVLKVVQELLPTKDVDGGAS